MVRNAEMETYIGNKLDNYYDKDFCVVFASF